jgi:hypothetical protein
MTEREALPYEDLGAWLTEDLFPGWARYWNEAPAAPPKPPWYRNARVLLVMIAVAAAVLVVASVLLVTLDGADFNQTRQLRSISPATSAPATTALQTASATPLPTPSPVTELQSAPTTAPDASAEPPPPPAPRRPDTNPSDGPRINVTRAPMSFTPGITGKP